MEFYTSLTLLYVYENEFQNPQIFQQTISLFPEQYTFASKKPLLKFLVHF
jgi:hypothetical protein